MSAALSGRVAIVTGGASGIGRAAVLLFARHGAAVVIADRNRQGGEEAAGAVAAAGGRAVFQAADVTIDADCRAAVERALTEFGGLHVLFNNAGIIHRSTVVEMPPEEWERTMAVNVRSIFLMSRHAIPVMARGGGGAIVNTASNWGLVGGRRAAAYCASKGAVVLLTKAMALDHAPEKVRVNCVCPGDTDTPMLRGEARQLGMTFERFLEEAGSVPLGRVGAPEEVAQAALFLASDASAYVTGAALVVDGGVVAE
jgi:NAD(P)-dependent dehydrogenase (short-subunit alcohol dehydrogenase family)